jgi:hypothetical protein
MRELLEAPQAHVGTLSAITAALVASLDGNQTSPQLWLPRLATVASRHQHEEAQWAR